MDNPVIIFGAEGRGKLALDIFTNHGIVVYCFLDDNTSLHNKEINDIIVMGATDDSSLTQIIGPQCEAFIALDEISLRKNIAEDLIKKRKKMPINAIHKSAFVSERAELGHGNLIGAGAILNTDAKIGNMCTLNSGAVIDYSASVGNFVDIGQRAVVSPNTEIGNEVFIGAGAVLVSGVKVGDGARIGAGSVVVSNVEEGQTVFGNPAASVQR